MASRSYGPETAEQARRAPHAQARVEQIDDSTVPETCSPGNVPVPFRADDDFLFDAVQPRFKASAGNVSSRVPV